MRPETAVRLDRTAGRPVYALHRAAYRLSGGLLGGSFAGRPILLLTTTGRRSGRPRQVPMQYMPRGDSLVVVGSNGGRPTDPAWVGNLLAHPQVEVQIRRRVQSCVARVVTGSDRGELWHELGEFYPGYAHYETLTDRVIPVVELRPL